MKNKFKVYLAGIMFPYDDKVDKKMINEWRDYLKNSAEHRQEIEFYDPRDWFGVKDDKKKILDSDLVIVNYFRPSVGTSMEILWAYLNHVPVILINSSGKKELSPWIHEHCIKIIDNKRRSKLEIANMLIIERSNEMMIKWLKH